ncbi:MAG: DNA alkylation repair protein [Phycisphaerae bacterium]|nr:DNA alkylation repair protein [Phycisphaerae bacterium]
MPAAKGRKRSARARAGSDHPKASAADSPPVALPDDENVDAIIGNLKRLASRKHRDALARFAIPDKNAFGVPVGRIQSLAMQLKRSAARSDDSLAARHRLAIALWDTGWYEARLLAVFVDEPSFVTASQMDRWAKQFEHWADCDTACFHLFDRTPHAFRKVHAWAARKEEFVKRAAFALLASIALHDKNTDDDVFAECLVLIEREAGDDRNFVKKAVNWALRAIGGRSPALHGYAVSLAQHLAESETPSARWIGKDALRAFRSRAMQSRLNRKARKKSATTRRSS